MGEALAFGLIIAAASAITTLLMGAPNTKQVEDRPAIVQEQTVEQKQQQ